MARSRVARLAQAGWASLVGCARMIPSAGRSAVIRIVVGTFLMLPIVVAWAAGDRTYEAPLPAQLFTDPDLCRYAPCTGVIPGADTFSTRKGSPPYVEAYRSEAGGKQRVGYVFLSSDIVDIPGYSGKPIIVLVGMDTRGRITGASVLRHAESILRIGIPEAKLGEFVGQYVGNFIGEEMWIGRPRTARNQVGLDAISGATVTAVALHQVIRQSGIEVARQVGILAPAARPEAAFADVGGLPGWKAMVDEGSIGRLVVSSADLGVEGGTPLEIHFGYLNPPPVGRRILGAGAYDALMARLRPGEHAIFVVGNGVMSFKGSGFARGGIFERIQVAQDMDTFIFRDLDYLNLERIEAEGAPAYRESGIFIIRSGRFSGASPWRLVFLASRTDRASGARTFSSFEEAYRLPARYLVGAPVEPPGAVQAGAWDVWRTVIVIAGLLLAAAVLVYALRTRGPRRRT